MSIQRTILFAIIAALIGVAVGGIERYFNIDMGIWGLLVTIVLIYICFKIIQLTSRTKSNKDEDDFKQK